MYNIYKNRMGKLICIMGRISKGGNLILYL